MHDAERRLHRRPGNRLYADLWSGREAQLHSGLVFSADRYQVRIVNSLGYNGADYYLQGCLASNGDPFFCNGIVRDPTTGSIGNAPAGNPSSGFVRQGTTNYYRTLAYGWDFQGQYSLT